MHHCHHNASTVAIAASAERLVEHMYQHILVECIGSGSEFRGVGFAKDDRSALQQGVNKRIILLSYLVLVNQTALECTPQSRRIKVTQPLQVCV